LSPLVRLRATRLGYNETTTEARQSRIRVTSENADPGRQVDVVAGQRVSNPPCLRSLRLTYSLLCAGVIRLSRLPGQCRHRGSCNREAECYCASIIRKSSGDGAHHVMDDAILELHDRGRTHRGVRRWRWRQQ
jgi:hypothetical protein